MYFAATSQHEAVEPRNRKSAPVSRLCCITGATWQGHLSSTVIFGISIGSCLHIRPLVTETREPSCARNLTKSQPSSYTGDPPLPSTALDTCKFPPRFGCDSRFPHCISKICTWDWALCLSMVLALAFAFLYFCPLRHSREVLLGRMTSAEKLQAVMYHSLGTPQMLGFQWCYTHRWLTSLTLLWV